MKSMLVFHRSGRRLLGALMFWAFLGPVQAGLFEDDEARKAILDLRQRVDQTNATIRNLSEENAQLRRSLLDIQSQIDGLKTEQSQVRGSQERLARDLSETQLSQKDIANGVNERLRRFEPVKVSADGLEFMAEPGEKRDYESALDLFRKGDFPMAQVALSQFVQRYGKSGYLPSALFWLGNAQYVKKEYPDAMASFQQMLKIAPSHARAAEGFLAISNVQIELKDLKGARKTMEELVKGYPASDAAATARDRLARLR